MHPAGEGSRSGRRWPSSCPGYCSRPRRDQLCAGDPALEALYRGANGLQQRVRSFWTDGVADFGELLVLADLAHVIGSVEIDELLAGMAQAAAHSPKELALSSEDESDRAVFLQRLDRLRRSPRLRRDYARLLGELWAEVAEAWEAKGRRLVEVAAERYRHRLERGAKWFDLVIADSEHLFEHLPGLIARVCPARVP